MPVSSYGGSTDSLASPSLSSWAASVSAALDGSDTTVNTRLTAKANLASPTFTGTVTLPSDVRGWATNLLTTNQASVETDTSGLASANASTIARSTAQAYIGSASLLMTSSIIGPAFAGGTPRPGSGTTVPVTAGLTYTASARVLNSVGSRQYRLRILWWNAAGANLGDTGAQALAISSAAPSSWQQLIAVGVAPANATQVSIEVDGYTSGSIGDAVYIDALGFWVGAGGIWAMPGVPISAMGSHTDESVGRRVFTWDGVNSRWQMIYGDTGWRDVSTLFTGSWLGNWNVRRINSVVYHNLFNVRSGTGAVWNAPAGFRGGISTTDVQSMPVSRYDLASHSAIGCNNGGAGNYTVLGGAIGYAGAVINAVITTYEAWPSSLPGTAVGSIPAL